jgi:hypothetical protein
MHRLRLATEHLLRTNNHQHALFAQLSSGIALHIAECEGARMWGGRAEERCAVRHLTLIRRFSNDGLRSVGWVRRFTIASYRSGILIRCVIVDLIS